MSINEADIDAFGRFAKEQRHVGAELSLQQLLAKWEADREAKAVAEEARDKLARNGVPEWHPRVSSS